MYPAAPELHSLSLHDALPICASCGSTSRLLSPVTVPMMPSAPTGTIVSFGRSRQSKQPNKESLSRMRTSASFATRSEEHTSELQSHVNLVCRLLLEKKKHVPT